MKKDTEFLMKTGGRESFEAVFSLMEQAFPPSERRTRQARQPFGKRRVQLPDFRGRRSISGVPGRMGFRGIPLL